MREDTIIWPRLLDLAECLQREIVRADVPRPGFLGVVPGALVIPDFCGEDCGGGQAWVRLVTGFPSVDGSTPAPPTFGVAPLAFTVEVGILRCASMPADDGTPPGVAEQLEDVRLQMADMNVILRAIECCFTDGSGIPLRYTPVGPDGGCVGGTWTVAVAEVLGG